MKKPAYLTQAFDSIGRSERIRTFDPHNPIVVRYQAALRSARARILGVEAVYVNADVCPTALEYAGSLPARFVVV